MSTASYPIASGAVFDREAIAYIITPEETIETHSSHPCLTGIDWSALRPDQLETIPILRALKRSTLK